MILIEKYVGVETVAKIQSNLSFRTAKNINFITQICM